MTLWLQSTEFNKNQKLTKWGFPKMDLDQEVEIKVKGQIELPKVDIEPFIGKKVKIEKVTTHQSRQYGGYYLKVQTEIVAQISEKKELRASRVFGLQEDDNGNIGWGEKTKLGVFMKKMQCTSLEELKEKEVTLISQTNKDGMDFLSFN